MSRVNLCLNYAIPRNSARSELFRFRVHLKEVGEIKVPLYKNITTFVLICACFTLTLYKQN